MPIASVSIAAAVAVINYDLLQGSVHRQSGRRRRLVGAGVAGSAVVNDALVNLYVGSQLVAQLYNSSLGAVTKDVDMFPLNELVPAGTEVRALVADAPVTNPINLVADFR